jgi:hypothetical protein
MPPEKIRVLTYMYGNLSYFDESRKINSAYCLSHGYDYVVDTASPRMDRKVNWAKLPAIIRHLTDCDYLLYMDADAVFNAHELTIEDEILSVLHSEEIAMAVDVGSELLRWHPNRPNSGVIFMKNTPTVHKFLDCWDKSTDTHPEWCFSHPADEKGLWHDAMVQYPVLVRTVKDYYLFNGIYGQYIRHFMAMPSDKRLYEMQKISKRLFQ